MCKICLKYKTTKPKGDYLYSFKLSISLQYSSTPVYFPTRLRLDKASIHQPFGNKNDFILDRIETEYTNRGYEYTIIFVNSLGENALVIGVGKASEILVESDMSFSVIIEDKGLMKLAVIEDSEYNRKLLWA